MADPKRRARDRWVVLALSVAAQAGGALAAQSVAPLAPIFQPELGLSKTEIGLFSSAVFAGAWGVLLVGGTMADRFGVRVVTSLAHSATGALVLCMSLVTSFPQAVAVMLGVGVGRGAMVPGITKAVADWFPPASRATAMGVNQAAIPLAGLLVASLLPSLALRVGWRGAIAGIGIVILAGAAAIAVLYRDSRGPAPAARGARREGALRKVIRNRRLWAVAATGPLFSAVHYSLTTYLALYFAEQVLTSAIPDESMRIVAAGGFLALCHAGGTLARVLWGLVSDRFLHGRRMALLSAVSAFSALASLMLGALDPGHPMWLMSAVVFVAGVAATGWQGLYLVVGAERAGPGCTGAGVGLCMTGSQLGLVAGPPLFGLVLDLSGSYQVGWLFLALLGGAGAVASAVMARGEACSARTGASR